MYEKPSSNLQKPGLILDLCGTLYLSDELSSLYKEKLVEAVATKYSFSKTKASEAIKEKTRILTNRLGFKPSTLYLAIQFGIKQEYMDGTNHIDPTPFVTYSEKTNQLIRMLANEFNLSILTHSTEANTKKILDIMKIQDCFKTIVGSESIQNPKPHKGPFKKIVDSLGILPERCIMVGDRVQIDLEPAKNLGMKTILVGAKSNSNLVDYTIPSINSLQDALSKIKVR